MQTRYDPTIIQRFADELYTTARRITTVMTVICGIVGGGSGFAIGNALGANNPAALTIYQAVGAAVLGVVLGLIGFAVGRSYGFGLQLKAQMALCLMKIESNTHPIELPKSRQTDPDMFR